MFLFVLAFCLCFVCVRAAGVQYVNKDEAKCTLLILRTCCCFVH